MYAWIILLEDDMGEGWDTYLTFSESLDWGEGVEVVEACNNSGPGSRLPAGLSPEAAGAAALEHWAQVGISPTWDPRLPPLVLEHYKWEPVDPSHTHGTWLRCLWWGSSGPRWPAVG